MHSASCMVVGIWTLRWRTSTLEFGASLLGWLIALSIALNYGVWGPVRTGRCVLTSSILACVVRAFMNSWAP